MDLFLDQRFARAYAEHPLVLVDVGARGGVKSNWARARPHLRVLGFEPDPAEFRRLLERSPSSSASDTVFNTALHRTRGPITLHLTRDRGLSSVFEPNRSFVDQFPASDRFDIVDVQQVEADTLDNVLRARGLDDVDFVKADTQGSELMVLQGGAEILRSSVFGVEVEVEFAPVYTDQPLFAEVDAYLRSLGFLLFDLRPCYWKRRAGQTVGSPRGQMIWGDALYLRGIQDLRRARAGLDRELQKTKVLRAMSIALLYGYHDYALELAGDAAEMFDARDAALIDARIRESGADRGPLPRFPGRRQLAAASHRLWKLFLQKDEDSWSISGAKLGN